jgi:hypothetical protein
VATINDNDPEPSLSINDVSPGEGTGAPFNANFTVTLSPASGRTVTVQYATSDGTATAPADYTATSGTLTFLPGVTTQPITVVGQHDLLDEIDETFTVTLSSPLNATFGDDTGVGTILDNDAEPALSIDDVSAAEGTGGTTTLGFTVTLTPVSGRTVTVQYATGGGSATAGTDYTTASGTLTFPAGVTTQPVNVTVQSDALDEADTETFNVTLSSPSNATISDNTGVGTIDDDDPLPTLTINSVGVTEGNSGTVNANFTVTLTPASGRTVGVDWATSNVTATAGSDYTANSGTLTFTPGVTTQPITVVVSGDFLAEDTETFNVTLSGQSSATVGGGGIGVGTITNDDIPGFTIVQTGGNTEVTEGDPAPGTTDTFTVVLTAQPASNVVFTIVSASTQEVLVQTPTLTFTPSGGTAWDIPQVVTVAGGGSGVDDGDQMTDVTVSIDDAESNSFFDPVADQVVVVTTIDIDGDGEQEQQDQLDFAMMGTDGSLDRAPAPPERPADRASVEVRALPWRGLGYSVGGIPQ